jgi:hypothetical protein
MPRGAAPTTSGGPTINNIPAQHNDAYMSDTDAESSLRGVAVQMIQAMKDTPAEVAH